MNLILFGLGNNSPKYYKTKHNIGRILVESLGASKNNSFTLKKSFSFIKSVETNNNIYYLYSNGYMNEIGKPLYDFLRYFNIDHKFSQIVVIQDDSDQKEGSYKIVDGGGSAGHKGIDSIYKNLLSTDFTTNSIRRLKIGIRPDKNSQKSETFVLKSITAEDKKNLNYLSNLISSNPFILLDDLPKIQNIYHSKR